MQDMAPRVVQALKNRGIKVMLPPLSLVQGVKGDNTRLGKLMDNFRTNYASFKPQLYLSLHSNGSEFLCSAPNQGHPSVLSAPLFVLTTAHHGIINVCATLCANQHSSTLHCLWLAVVSAGKRCSSQCDCKPTFARYLCWYSHTKDLDIRKLGSKILGDIKAATNYPCGIQVRPQQELNAGH